MQNLRWVLNLLLVSSLHHQRHNWSSIFMGW
ncbi:BnaA09g05330D [Brassica napus]|uniref:BnaA09g05330D protein n=1 Tax=Brassica napus TaxID=3708 RepID=A0A078FUY9_BRANA|nr:BnaA09g05330D [Brassica napus]